MVTPDGRFAYIANASFPEVDASDTTTYQLTTIPTGGRSRRICISPAGDRVYATNYHDDAVFAIDTATQQLIATIPIGQGARPMGIAMTPDGEEVYVTNQHSGTVSVITLPTGHQPWTILATPDDMTLYVCNGTDTTLTVIDIPSLTVSATIANVGSHPFDLAFGL
ncbi:MAG: hypothetical protein DME51_03835 [Verrucomicrobia bacterium]|nr:MAG: hypothetical protein DME51_03835 [Verrucomicrobiota bacterium]